MSRKQEPNSPHDAAEGSDAGKDRGGRDVSADAAGQFRRSKKGKDNSGIASAEPRVISGDDDGDATFPLRQDSR